jgi:hypothetical protein
MIVCCLKRIKSANFYIHTVFPPDVGLRYARNMYRLTKYTKKKLRTKMVFLYTVILKNYFNNQLNAQFLYSIRICMLRYNLRHVSSINMPIFKRTNCIITASGIVTPCKRLYSIESDDSRCCDNTICPLEDGHVNARNMSRIIM